MVHELRARKPVSDSVHLFVFSVFVLFFFFFFVRISLCACKINQCSISTPEYITNDFFLLLLFLVLLVSKIEREKKEDIKQINESIPLDGSGGDGGGSSKNNNKWIQRYSSRYTHTHTV